MNIQEKPDYLIFAESAKKGEVSDFPDVGRGWGVTIEQTGSKPPLEWMNGAFNRVDKNMLYLLQQGVPEWSESVKYPANAIIKYNGVLYTAIVENDNSNPATSTTKWKKTQAEVSKASTTQSGIVKLNSSTNSTSETEAATPLAVKKVNDLATENHNKLSNIIDKFQPLDFESVIFSPNKEYHATVRNDGVFGFFDKKSTNQNLSWAVDKSGGLVHGYVNVDKIRGLEDFINNFIPVGIPMPWPTVTPPAGWLSCNGWKFDKNKYPKLAQAYPSGYLPDMRANTIRGLDAGRGIDIDRTILNEQGDAMRNLTGTFGFESNIGGNTGLANISGVFYSVSDPSRKHLTGGTEHGNSTVVFDASRQVPIAAEFRVRNIAFLYIVRAA